MANNGRTLKRRGRAANGLRVCSVCRELWPTHDWQSHGCPQCRGTKVSIEHQGWESVEIDDSIPDTCNTLDILHEKLRNEDVCALIKKALPERYFLVICLRFGLYDGHPRCLYEVASVFQVTRERVRQIEARSLLKLREGHKYLMEFYE